MILAWAMLAPTQVGGWDSYVIVNGNSMETDFHRGDLVITRKQPPGGYEVGDVIAYRHPQIGAVIHRIVGREDDRFVLKGDNNSWLDSYQPVESEVMGKSWIHIPQAGKFLGAMHSPLGIFALSLTMGVIAMTSFSTTKDKNRKNGSGSNTKNDARIRMASFAGSSGEPPGRKGDVEGVITLLGAVLLASLFLGFFAFTRPASVPVSGDVGFRNTGEFSYSANVPTDVYQEGEIRSGEPVFRQVTDEIEIAFDYRLDSELPTEDIEGTYRLDAVVSDVNGWSHTVILQPERAFSGGEIKASGILDIAEIEEITSTLEEKTGLSTDRYSVSVVPEVMVGGELGGQPVEDVFAPSLDFWLDSIQMQLQNPAAVSDTDATSIGGTDSATENPLTPSEDGAASNSATEGNTLSIFGLEIGVAAARVIALIALIASALGLARFGLPMLQARQSADEPTRILARHSAKLISVESDIFDHDDEVVITLSDFADLVKIAELSDQSILYHNEDPAHDYYVLDAETVYHYRATTGQNGNDPETGKPFTETVRELWR